MSVLIVGAGPGMGAALAHEFGDSDTQVGLIARRAAPAAAIVDSLAERGITAHAGLANVGDATALRTTIHGLIAEIGPPDTVVFNASAFVDGPPSSVDVDAFNTGLLAGVTGALVTLQTVLPDMQSAGAGTILMTGGATALKPWTAACGLSAQKAAMRNLAFAAADELAPAGVHVCTITIMGAITSGTSFDPKLIAKTFAEVARQPKSQWEPEVRFNG